MQLYFQFNRGPKSEWRGITNVESFFIAPNRTLSPQNVVLLKRHPCELFVLENKTKSGSQLTESQDRCNCPRKLFLSLKFLFTVSLFNFRPCLCTDEIQLSVWATKHISVHQKNQFFLLHLFGSCGKTHFQKIQVHVAELLLQNVYF